MQRRARTWILTVAGAAAVALTLYAGRRNPSLALRLIFCGWVAAPFVAAAARAVPDAAALVIAAASLLVYAAEAFGILDAKMGFVFLVTPAVSLALVGAAALLNRPRSQQAR